MADLLFRVSWAAQNHFMPRFALRYTQGPCQEKPGRPKENGLGQSLSYKIKYIDVMKKIIYREYCSWIAKLIIPKQAYNAPIWQPLMIILRPTHQNDASF
jgi:hypothetical protein